jgi:Uma2 family endonuclease
MKTVVLGDPPPQLASLLAERKRLGLDRHDEVWQGEYHMAPAADVEHGAVGARLAALLAPAAAARNLVVTLEFNLGTSDDFRVPDLGVHRGQPAGVWLDTAAIVVEVRSPDDETFDKFAFYAAHGVDEILVADLTSRTVTWFGRRDATFVKCAKSTILDVSSSDIATQLDWK